MTVYSARVGDNADLFADIAELYLKPGDRVADVTYGTGRFWQDVRVQADVYGSDVARRGMPLDLFADCRRLPYADASFDALVVDPPYKAGTSAPMRDDFDGYGNNARAGKGVDAVYAFYTAALREAMRVVRPKGLVIVKCMDQVESGRNHWHHLDLALYGERIGCVLEDFFVLMRRSPPPMRHDHQVHSRKNCSYFLVFRRGAA